LLNRWQSPATQSNIACHPSRSACKRRAKWRCRSARFAFHKIFLHLRWRARAVRYWIDILLDYIVETYSSTALPGTSVGSANRSEDQLAIPLTPVDKPRLAMIDIAKGIGILLIVLGHDLTFAERFGGAGDLLKAFRMPFFFFISGATFSLGQRTVSTIAKERADAWLKPFAVTVLFFGLLNVFFGTATLERMFLGLVYGTGFTLSPIAIWFLPHLWLLYVCCAVLLRHGQGRLETWPRRIAFLSLVAVAGYFFLNTFDSVSENAACRQINEFDWRLFDCGLPFSADFLPLTAVYFLLGHFLSSMVKAFKLNIVLSGIAALMLVGSHYLFHYTIDLNSRRYDDLVVSTLQALVGIYMMLNVSSFLTRSAVLSRLLTYIGRGSLFILLFHMPVMYNLPKLIPHTGPSLLLAAAGIAVSILVPLAIWEMVKRSKLASMLLLPKRRKRLPADSGDVAPGLR
jgi:fucose 4-O-acetylase-like acetyltransferase